MSEHQPPGDSAFLPGPGRRVRSSFIDAETGYRVVEHVSEHGHDLRVALLDPLTAELVPVERRARELGSGETVRLDMERGLRLTTSRTIDVRTGQETLHELLTDVSTGAQLARRTSVALRASREEKDLLAQHLEWRAEQERGAAFWRDEYPRWSFEHRAEYFFDQLRRRIRTHEELGLDPHSVFTSVTYAEWRAVEPEIDRVLDAVADRLGLPREVIDERTGRGRPRRKPRRR